MNNNQLPARPHPFFVRNWQSSFISLTTNQLCIACDHYQCLNSGHIKALQYHNKSATAIAPEELEKVQPSHLLWYCRRN